jgi:hypothetical protein
LNETQFLRFLRTEMSIFENFQIRCFCGKVDFSTEDKNQSIKTFGCFPIHFI